VARGAAVDFDPAGRSGRRATGAASLTPQLPQPTAPGGRRTGAGRHAQFSASATPAACACWSA
jgi:hypothetical protein